MEAGQKLVNVPIRPIVLLVALFCAIAIALVSWYALAAATPTRVSAGAVTSSGGFPGPDAQDRNQRLQQAHQSPDPETTHGH